jgi:hypothetical protein
MLAPSGAARAAIPAKLPIRRKVEFKSAFLVITRCRDMKNAFLRALSLTT